MLKHTALTSARFTLLMPICRPKSGPAVTGPGDSACIWVLANVGYADLFCFDATGASTFVSTRSEPVAGLCPNWKVPPSIALVAVGVVIPAFCSSFRFAAMRARSDDCASFGSLFVLMERARPSGAGGVALLVSVFAPGAPGGVPDCGSSVWMKQQRLPYGHEPDTQKVYGDIISDQQLSNQSRTKRTLHISVLY